MKHTLFSTLETAKIAGVHVNTVYQNCRRGIIPAAKSVAGHFLITKKDLDAYIAGRANGTIHGGRKPWAKVVAR